MQIPGVILASLPRKLGRDAAQMEQQRASLIGNAFHVPSVAIVLFLILADLAAASSVRPPIYAADEAYLRHATWNTVFWPGVVREFPVQALSGESCLDHVPEFDSLWTHAP